MTKITLFKFIILIIFVQTASAQKIKYKDIFPLLNTKQYNDVEPFLKKYLTENDDNGNAFLFMGIIYQEKSLNDDVLKQTDVAIQHMDSAVLYYDKALKVIDEKELRKNKEYYVAFNRRDLRTGEFGVKLSDVQLDLENRMASMRERIDKVKMVNYYFELSSSLYERSNELYRSMQKKYPSLKALYLRATDETVTNLSVLSNRYDSCAKAFENYRTSTGNLGNTGYNQSWKPQDIKDFGRDGVEKTDFYKEELRVWDYKTFADKSKEVIEKEVRPMQENLVSYDIEINKLKQKLEKDSVSVKSDLTKIIDKLLGSQLKKFDPNPLPMSIFSIKIAELNYLSSRVESKAKKDSSDVRFQLALSRNEMQSLTMLDSLVTQLLAGNMDEETENYKQFITSTYNRPEILKSYLRSLKEFATRELKQREQTFARRLEALRWLVNQNDSIPLFTEGNSTRFKPLLIEDNKYTAGLFYNDSASAQGYFYTITPSHVPKIKVSFAVDKPAFSLSKLGSSKALITDVNEQIYFVMVFNEQKSGDKFSGSLAKIYRSDGLSWANNIMLDFLPERLSVNPDTGDVEITSGGEQKVLIDKNGKRKN